MKSIKLDDRYSIDRDNYCWMLKYREEKGVSEKTGKVKVSERTTYHATLQQTLSEYVDSSIRVAESVSELKERLEGAMNVIERLEKEKQQIVMAHEQGRSDKHNDFSRDGEKYWSEQSTSTCL